MEWTEFHVSCANKILQFKSERELMFRENISI